jgi:hypothetical protein
MPRVTHREMFVVGYAFLADLALVVHLSFVLFASLGGLLALRWRRAPWVHLPAAVWGVLIEVGGGVCPLTPLENRLREAAGAIGYEGGFVEHYLVALLYPAGLSRNLQFTLAGVLVAMNLAVYAAVWRRRSRR